MKKIYGERRENENENGSLSLYFFDLIKINKIMGNLLFRIIFDALPAYEFHISSINNNMKYHCWIEQKVVEDLEMNKNNFI